MTAQTQRNGDIIKISVIPDDLSTEEDLISELANTYTTDLLSKMQSMEDTMNQPKFLTLPARSAIFEVLNEPPQTKEGPSTRVVQIDARRAVAETLEQLYIKEIESTWINEMERYNSLKDL